MVAGTDTVMAEQPPAPQDNGLALQVTDVAIGGFGLQSGAESKRMGVPAVVMPFSTPDTRALWACK